jgi:hypothetical protein
LRAVRALVLCLHFSASRVIGRQRARSSGTMVDVLQAALKLLNRPLSRWKAMLG